MLNGDPSYRPTSVKVAETYTLHVSYPQHSHFSLFNILKSIGKKMGVDELIQDALSRVVYAHSSATSLSTSTLASPVSSPLASPRGGSAPSVVVDDASSMASHSSFLTDTSYPHPYDQSYTQSGDDSYTHPYDQTYTQSADDAVRAPRQYDRSPTLSRDPSQTQESGHTRPNRSITTAHTRDGSEDLLRPTAPRRQSSSGTPCE